jgi:DHA1 family bicyclomycin/chloramphenicol resistance-like MFS transporter
MVFLTPPLFAVAVFVWSLRLQESLPKERRTDLKFRNVRSSIKKVLGNAVFRRYTTITTFLFSALSSWVASSEHIVGEIYKKPQLFSWVFSGIGVWLAICTLTNSRLSQRFGARRTLLWLLVCYVFVATILLGATLLFRNPPDMVLFVIAVGLLLGVNLAVEPNSSSLAMEPMGNMAGLASSIYGTCFFFLGAGIGSFMSSLMKTSVLPLITGFFIIGVITLWLAASDRRPHPAIVRRDT